jgi:carboxymethylenebutenolidase
MTGQMVEFPANGSTAGGYLAPAEGGPAPGVLVLQEWWGLVPQIKRVCDELAGEGFTALAPDLYHGEFAEHTEMDKAGELMTSLPPDRAARDMSAAVDYLLASDATTGDSIGAVGFCMGGMLTLRIAALEGDRVAAAAPFYGAPLGDDSIDWSKLSAKVVGHFAENDDFFGPGPVQELEAKLRGMGKDVTFTVHPGTGHGFTNDEDPLGTYDEKATASTWATTLALFREEL